MTNSLDTSEAEARPWVKPVQSVPVEEGAALTKEETVLGAFLAAMHDSHLDGGKMREAMLNVLGLTATQQAAPSQGEEARAYGYAKRLAESIWECRYKDVSPNWKAMDTLIGILTQIDNMAAGLLEASAQREQHTNFSSDIFSLLFNEWFATTDGNPSFQDCFAAGLNAQREQPADRDNEWVLAMAEALGTNSEFTVPIVPDSFAFRALFADIAKHVKQEQPAASKPEPQAQAGEPCKSACSEWPNCFCADLQKPMTAEELCIKSLQTEIEVLDEVIAKKDAALKACVEALEELQGIIHMYHKNGPDWTHKDGTEVFEVSVLLDRQEAIDAAITQGQEAMK